MGFGRNSALFVLQNQKYLLSSNLVQTWHELTGMGITDSVVWGWRVALVVVAVLVGFVCEPESSKISFMSWVLRVKKNKQWKFKIFSFFGCLKFILLGMRSIDPISLNWAYTTSLRLKHCCYCCSCACWLHELVWIEKRQDAFYLKSMTFL